jgi:hypothetical protein
MVLTLSQIPLALCILTAFAIKLIFIGRETALDIFCDSKWFIYSVFISIVSIFYTDEKIEISDSLVIFEA